MATEVSPEGGEAQGALTDGTVGDGAGSAAAPGAGGGATAGIGAGAGSGEVPGAKGGSGPTSEPGVRSEAGAGSASEGVWDDTVLDEDFIRSAETAEPSARARMLAARWRQQAPDPQPWRSDEPPAGWFFSKARRRRWRRR
ncbi:hypothetical protein ACKI2D_15275 [Streptomyces europaeiscabiei]|uniref:SGM_3592 family protein n=1 Tax=Streptomyces europaeiscabiei TaxID=146819 RepID=UPI0038F702E0